MIVDDYSRYTEVYALPNKKAATVLEKVKEFIADHYAQGKLPATVMTDWGTEFMGEFEQFCIDKQIKIEHSCPYSAWQNGLVERANGALSRIARAMMLDRLAATI